MSDDKRKFQVDPRDIIRHAVREHEQQHGYFNVADEMVNKLETKFEFGMSLSGDMNVAMFY